AKDIYEINDLPTANLAKGEDNIGACSSEQLKKNCQQKGAEFFWDGSVCVRNLPSEISETDKQQQCEAKGANYKWQEGFCIQVVEGDKKSCLGDGLSWDEENNICIKVEKGEVATSSFLLPVSLISENI